MKKALLLLTIVVTITACQSTQNPNANLNSNSGNQNANAPAVVREQCETTNAQQVVGDIIIKSGGMIDAPTKKLEILKSQKAIWCVKNQSNDVVNVTLAHFHRNVFLGSTIHHPFGNQDAKDNTYTSGPINPGDVKNVPAKEAKKLGKFEFDVLLFDKDCKPLDFEDPQVVISEGMIVKSSNRNTGTRNSNTKTNRNK